MALVKLEDFDPNYRESFDERDVKGMGVYAEGDEKIGTVSDALVDEEGHFRYFIVDLGFWIFGKKVLLPVGRSRVDYDADRIYAVGMTREQADHLPEYDNVEKLDYDYEEQVRGVYRTPASGASVSPVTDAVAPINTSAPLDAPYSTSMTGATVDQNIYATSDEVSAPEGIGYNPAAYTRDSYSYQQEPTLYNLNEQDHQTLKLYEERLIANKRRVKSGEVTVGKRVETETARVSVPIEKERVVIERVTPTDAGRVVSPGEATFSEGEVTHVEIYEETPDIRKEAFVREEVNVRKEVDHDTVNAEETLRREELDIDTQGTATVERGELPKDRI